MLTLHILLNENKVAVISRTHDGARVSIYDCGLVDVLANLQPETITVWQSGLPEAALQAQFWKHTLRFRPRESGYVLDLVFDILDVI